jgi:hypothetical protein
MDAIETVEREGFTMSIFIDPEPSSPDDWDNLGTLIHSAPFTFGESIREPERGWRNYIRAMGIFGDDVAGVVPVRVDDYGSNGLRIYVSDAENANGLMATTHKRLNELCGEAPQYHAREWVEDALKGEVEVWGQYAEGDVYGYDITGPDGEHRDSCWGFYGAKYAREEAEEALSWTIKNEAETEEAISRIVAL